MSETEQTARWHCKLVHYDGVAEVALFDGDRNWQIDDPLADYLNTLEARAALADLLRSCFIVNNGWVVELSMPHTVMDEFVRRYDALTQCTQEVGR